MPGNCTISSCGNAAKRNVQGYAVCYGHARRYFRHGDFLEEQPLRHRAEPTKTHKTRQASGQTPGYRRANPGSQANSNSASELTFPGHDETPDGNPESNLGFEAIPEGLEVPAGMSLPHFQTLVHTSCWVPNPNGFEPPIIVSESRHKHKWRGDFRG